MRAGRRGGTLQPSRCLLPTDGRSDADSFCLLCLLLSGLPGTSSPRAYVPLWPRLSAPEKMGGHGRTSRGDGSGGEVKGMGGTRTVRALLPCALRASSTDEAPLGKQAKQAQGRLGGWAESEGHASRQEDFRCQETSRVALLQLDMVLRAVGDTVFLREAGCLHLNTWQ